MWICLCSEAENPPCQKKKKIFNPWTETYSYVAVCASPQFPWGMSHSLVYYAASPFRSWKSCFSSQSNQEGLTKRAAFWRISASGQSKHIWNWNPSVSSFSCWGLAEQTACQEISALWLFGLAWSWILQQAVLSASHQRREGVLSGGGSSSLKVFLLASPLSFWGSQQRRLKTKSTWSWGTWQPFASANRLQNTSTWSHVMCMCVCVKCFIKVRSVFTGHKATFLRLLLIKIVIKGMVVNGMVASQGLLLFY